MAEIKKYVKDGEVAVAVSPGYGAGWSTWESDTKLIDTLVFHPDIIQMILDGKAEEMNKYWLVEHFGVEFNNVYTEGRNQLIVEWLPVGTKFRIDEYDGHEEIVYLNEEKWFEA
jgi:hypothetical protein